MRISLILASCISLLFVSCETLDKDPKPEREKISSMPHNIPESWEGQAGLPGQLGGGY